MYDASASTSASTTTTVMASALMPAHPQSARRLSSLSELSHQRSVPHLCAFPGSPATGLRRWGGGAQGWENWIVRSAEKQQSSVPHLCAFFPAQGWENWIAQPAWMPHPFAGSSAKGWETH